MHARRLDVELSLVSRPHLATSQVQFHLRAAGGAAKRNIIHKAPALHHIVDAVSQVRRVNDRGVSVAIEVEIWVVARGLVGRSKAIDKRLRLRGIASILLLRDA